ncbi:MAG: hypothetical protein ABJL72_10405 [Roseobacter sp.]
MPTNSGGALQAVKRSIETAITRNGSSKTYFTLAGIALLTGIYIPDSPVRQRFYDLFNCVGKWVKPVGKIMQR